ncbi:MAG: DoxX family protein [Thermoleophilia bacterium]|nr:DoxX family protein [Thermoleophilia bacterium]
MQRFRTILRGLLALLFIGAGSMHFLRPHGFVHIVPEQLPRPELLVSVSGVAEVLGGVGLLVPPVRRAAGIGLIALLVAVFPANVNMALHADRLGAGLPEWALWLRLPLQPALIAAVWLAAFKRQR